VGTRGVAVVITTVGVAANGLDVGVGLASTVAVGAGRVAVNGKAVGVCTDWTSSVCGFPKTTGKRGVHPVIPKTHAPMYTIISRIGRPGIRTEYILQLIHRIGLLNRKGHLQLHDVCTVGVNQRCLQSYSVAKAACNTCPASSAAAPLPSPPCSIMTATA